MQAGRIALSRFERGGATADLERARGHFMEAARRRVFPGACEASLALSRLEARYAQGPEAAYLQAYRTVARFARDPSQQPCVDAARFILAVLDAHRPPAAQLAAIDADPDADDPSVLGAAPVRDVGSGQRQRARLRALDLYAASTPELGASSSARVVLHFDAPPVFRRSEVPSSAQHPKQIVFDFEAAQAADGLALPDAPAQGGALSGLHVTPSGAGLCVAFDVAEGATYRLFALSAPPRLVLDVERRDAGVTPTVDGPLVLLDPGHGGENQGAVGHNGRTEAELALDITRRIRAWLARTAPHVRVRLTRESDVLLSLEERAAMANVLQADLFVSVHLNAAPERVKHGGVATFVLDVNNDRNVLRLAARENQTPVAAVGELQFLVGSLARAEQARQSRQVAQRIQRGALFGGRRFLPNLHDRGVRSAMFYVLVGAQMPAVLVEASFLTQREEAELLARPEYRDAIAQGIARGIRQHLADE